MLPDDGSGGGQSNTMEELIQAIGGKQMATIGIYAQAEAGTTFDGSQLLDRVDDILASGAALQAAVMPTGSSWQGLTTSDNSQAVNIANVMQQLLDKGVPEIHLRFAHEMNYYQTDGTYPGGPSDFIEGWGVVAAAVKAQCGSKVKMFWTPNVASASSYAQYAPDDFENTVDMVGIDFYPQSLSDGTFLNAMQEFHDTYASATIPMALGETGLGYSGAASDRVSWLSQIASATSSMPYLKACTWFNYQKGYDFKLIDTADTSTTDAFMSFMGI